MTDLAARAAYYAIEQIHITADRIREAWTWLVELTEPGPAAAVPAPAMTDEQAERLEAAAHQARAYRAWNLAHGTTALPASPAPVRLAVVDAQAVVDALLAHAVDRLRAAGHRPGHPVPVDGRPGVPDRLAWITGYRLGLGTTGRDGILLIEGAIATVRDPELAADVEQLLTRADRAARAAAADVDDPGEQLIDPATSRPARCPACGRRSLQRESTGLIRCVSQSCRCTGDAEPDHPECGCRRWEKRPELAHVWTRSGELELWDAIEAARPAGGRRGVGRGAAGHGGWQSRDMAGQQ